MYHNFGQALKECEDCWDGACTMNCSDRYEQPTIGESPVSVCVTPAFAQQSVQKAVKKRKEKIVSNRIKGLVVTFDKDYKEEDIEQLVAAIEMLRGVVEVSKREADVDDAMNRARIKSDLRDRMYKAMVAAFDS